MGLGLGLGRTDPASSKNLNGVCYTDIVTDKSLNSFIAMQQSSVVISAITTHISAAMGLNPRTIAGIRLSFLNEPRVSKVGMTI